MKHLVYIASPLKNREVNRQVASFLDENKIPYFLPESINIEEKEENLKQIGDLCFSSLDECNIVIVVAPFGLSTASEVGYIINRKRRGENVKLVLLQSNRSIPLLEAALTPYFDELLTDLKSLTKVI